MHDDLLTFTFSLSRGLSPQGSPFVIVVLCCNISCIRPRFYHCAKGNMLGRTSIATQMPGLAQGVSNKAFPSLYR
jgi:hypothetical protein